jgi:hypothetical protein
MSVNDVLVLNPGAFGTVGARKHNVAKEYTTVINPGEPVGKTLGGTDVYAGLTATPSVGTTYLAGIAVSTSSQTTTVDGTVDVLPIVSGVVYLGNPKTAASWDTQAEYDALVGKRVVFDLTAGAYTIASAPAVANAFNGLVIEPLDVAKHPGKVAFSIRQGASYTA